MCCCGCGYIIWLCSHSCYVVVNASLWLYLFSQRGSVVVVVLLCLHACVAVRRTIGLQQHLDQDPTKTPDLSSCVCVCVWAPPAGGAGEAGSAPCRGDSLVHEGGRLDEGQGVVGELDRRLEVQGCSVSGTGPRPGGRGRSHTLLRTNPQAAA